MSTPYTVLVILEAKPGKEKQLQAALEAVIKPSRMEAGCIEYRLHQDEENPAQFFFYENWKSKEILQQHTSQPYITDLGSKLDSLLIKPRQIIVGSELSAVNS